MKKLGVLLGFAISLTLIALIGCSQPATVVGKWKVDPAYNPSGLPAGFMTGFGLTFKYEFKPDKTFEAPMSSGTYEMKGNTVEVTTLKVMGQDAPHPNGAQMKGELSPDGKTLTLHPDLSSIQQVASLKDIPMIPDK